MAWVLVSLLGNESRGGVKKNNDKATYIYRSPPKEYVRTCIFYFFIFFIAFLGVSRHGEPRNSEKTFLDFFLDFVVMTQKATS